MYSASFTGVAANCGARCAYTPPPLATGVGAYNTGRSASCLWCRYKCAPCSPCDLGEHDGERATELLLDSRLFGSLFSAAQARASQALARLRIHQEVRR